MQFGISTACFYPEKTEDAFLFLAKSDIKHTEIFFNAECELNDEFLDNLINIKDAYGIKIDAVHPLLSVAEPFLLFSDYIRRFEDARRFYNKYFQVAKKLGANAINLHGDRRDSTLSAEEYCKRYKTLYRDGLNYGVLLNQENVSKYRSFNPEFIKLMREILNDEVSFTLDIKQCLRAGIDVDDMLNAMGEKINHVHISDHLKNNDCLLPGKGEFDFKNFFCKLKELNFNKTVTIEVYRNAYTQKEEVIDSFKKIEQM